MENYGFNENPDTSLAPLADAVKVRGFFRLQIEDGPTGKIVGDSGWKSNMITNTGFQHYMVELMSSEAGSSKVTHCALGKGTEPGVAGTSLESEHEVRETVVLASNGSKTFQATCTLASGISFVTNAQTLQNVGLFATSTKDGGSILCGNTFATSSVNVNQNVNVTYQIQFATS